MQLRLDELRPAGVEVRAGGSPLPQGSKVPQVVGERVRVRGRVAVIEPRVLLIDQSDLSRAKGERLADWRDKVHRAAFRAWRNAHGGTSPAPWDQAVELAAEFVFERPASHWTAAGQLRKGAPDLPTARPDLSKLVRAIEDSLTGVVYTDDARICRYGATEKRYAAYGRSGGVVIRVRPL